MNILYLLDFFPEENSTSDQIAGGVESRYFHLVKELRAQGHRVTVLPRSSSLKDVHKSSEASLFIIFDRLIGYQWRAIKAGLQVDFDVVEGGSWITYFTAFVLGKLKGKPLFFCYHDVAIGKWTKLYGPLGFIGELGERLILRLKPTAFIAVSESTKSALIMNGVHKNLIRVVQNGVDYESLSKVKVAKKSYDICCVARLVSYKHIDDLVRAVAWIANKNPKVKVAIIGKGPEEAKLLALSKKMGVGKNIAFLGHLPSHTAVMRVIAQSKVFVLPSGFEGFGISIIEAQALGVPVVASDIPALSEVTEQGKSGKLFKLQDNGELAQALSSLLTNRELAAKLVKEGKRNAEKYSWRKLSKKLMSIYSAFTKEP